MIQNKKRNIFSRSLAVGSLLLTSMTLFGCGNPKTYNNKPAQPRKTAMTKNAAIKIMKKPFTSASVEQKMVMTNSTKKKNNKQIVTNQVVFGGEPTVMQVLNRVKAGKQNRAIMGWLDGNHSYLVGNKNKYYKVDFDKLTGHNYADILDSVMNNYNITNPDKALSKELTVESKPKFYQIGGSTANKELMKGTAKRILAIMPQEKAQAIVFRNINRSAKFEQMEVTGQIRGDRLQGYKEKLIGKIGKNITLEITETYKNFNQYSGIKLPDEVANAKPLKMK